MAPQNIWCENITDNPDRTGRGGSAGEKERKKSSQSNRMTMDKMNNRTITSAVLTTSREKCLNSLDTKYFTKIGKSSHLNLFYNRTGYLLTFQISRYRIWNQLAGDASVAIRMHPRVPQCTAMMSPPLLTRVRSKHCVPR